MELVISDSTVDGDWYGRNLGEISCRKSGSTGTAQDIVGRVFVSVGSL
jgi:hypothetical protein